MEKNIPKKKVEESKSYKKRKKEILNEISDPSEIPRQNLKKVIEKLFDKGQIAKEIITIQPLYFDKVGIWWLWDDENKKWVSTDETDILNIIRKISNINTINRRDRDEILEALRQESRMNQPKEREKSWIQFKDKIFDLKTGDIFPATKEFFITNPIPYKIHNGKKDNTPTIDKIFKEWVGEKDYKILYEIIAYCLLTDYPLNRIFCFIGSGLNGKSCYLNLLRKFLGNENTTSTELDTLLSSRFELTRLHKKLACLMGETNFNEMRKTSILKKLTGNDYIGFEYKNRGLFEDINYAKILIATNNLPETDDKSIGFYRRWIIIDFSNQFSEKVDILSTIPEEEFESLALKSCSILKELLEKREFTNEGTIEEKTKRFQDKADPLAKFIKEFCSLDNPDGIIITFQFEKRLNEFCKENKFRQFSEHSIGHHLKNLGLKSGRTRYTFKNKNKEGNIIEEEKQIRCWEGISWIEDIEQEQKDKWKNTLKRT